VSLSRSFDDYPIGFGDEVTDTEGRFQFEGLSPDRYIVIAAAKHAYGRSDGSVRVGLGQHVDDAVVLVQPATVVEGKVLVGAPPKPCAEPSLLLGSEDSDGVALYSALYSRAGPDGSVRIDRVFPGTYRFEVSCEGYTTVESPPVEVADRDVTGLVWTLSPSPIAKGTIRGRVLSSAGEPIRGAQVSVSGRGHRKDISGADGSFVLDHLEIGTLEIGRFTVEVRSERGVGPERGWKFEVGAGETVTSDLVLAAGGVISGTVTNPDGSPAANVVVWTFIGDAQRTSDASGRFRFEGLSEGHEIVQARADGDDDGTRQHVTVRPGQTSTVNLVVAPRTQRITGVVVGADGKPRSDVYVAASHDISDGIYRYADDADDHHVLTSADGAFGLGPLAEGTYVVHAYERGGAEGIVENVRPGTAVRLQLRQTGSITGTVHAQVDDFELEIEDTHVPMHRRETFYRTAGRYHVDELPAGSYRITVRAGGREAQITAELAPGAHRDHVDIAFDNRTRVVGRVIDVASKQPVAGLGVSVKLRGGSLPQTTKTDGDGRFEIADLPRGEVLIDLDDDKYVGVSVPHQLAGDEVELGDIYTVERHIRGPSGSIGVTTKDLRIAEIDPEGPAAKTELTVGDVVTSIDGIDVDVLASEAVHALFESPPGTAVHLGLARGATVTVVAAPR
jgi:Carboxypeptidase regulatory-like domain/PDZ domain